MNDGAHLAGQSGDGGDGQIGDHRHFVAGLDPLLRQRLTAKADAPGLTRLAVQLAAIVAIGFWIAFGGIGWAMLLPVQGTLIVFLFTAQHEATHETAFRTPWLNRFVCWMCGLAIAMPPAWFRYFHFAHHRHTHDPQRDPELASAKPQSVRQYLVYLSGLPLWWSMFRALFVNAAGQNSDAFVPPAGQRKVAIEARIMLALYAVLVVASFVLHSGVLLWVWIIPALLGQPFLRAYLLAEHMFCPHVADMFANTRTTFTTRLVRWLAWNMPYHAEHHVFPAVPFHRLPQFHAVARQRLQETWNGYASFNSEVLGRLGRN